MTNSNYNPQKWHDLNFKDKGAYVTAFTSFFLGFILLFIGFFINPMGEIDTSVITTWGTCLVYCGSIFGIAMYVKGETSEIRAELMNKMQNAMEDRFRRMEEKDIKVPEGTTPKDPIMDDIFEGK